MNSIPSPRSVEAPRCTVVSLPTAAAAPVKQTPRRGPLPNTVPTLRPRRCQNRHTPSTEHAAARTVTVGEVMDLYRSGLLATAAGGWPLTAISPEAWAGLPACARDFINHCAASALRAWRPQ